MLNPDRTSYCLSPQQQSVALPIRINQTTPVLMELLRVDVDTGLNETIVINNKQLKSMRKQAEKRHNGELYRDLLFTVKKPGIYRLQKVVDESNLEVRTRLSDVLIALCPKAVVKSTHADKCKGELSDVYLEVEGVPPLKIKYSRRVNGLEGGVSFQNVHLENSRSPLVNQKHSGLLIHPDYSDLSWAQPQRLQIPLNESLSTGGEWVYAIEEVHDAYGNVANYSSMIDEIDRTATKQPVQSHQFTVHERPRLSFTGCNAETSLEVAKGDSIELPLKFHPATRNYDGDGPFEITYSYSESNTPQDAGSPSKARRASLKSFNNKPRVKEPGWYSITGVSSRFCQGEVLEPSSCFMYNPPEPELSVRSEKVFDKCANNPVGLVVYLDLVGSPPFRVRYTVESDKGTETHSKVVHGLRGQLDLTPSEAGRYRYRFLDVSDNVYGPRSLKDKVPLLEQDVKPPASAQFWGWSSSKTREACFGESVSTQVMFAGEGPWTLQYELVHNGKRTKRELTSQSEFAEITTEPLQSGGEYVLSLTSVTDQSKCKRPLQDSLRIDVRSKKPHAAFGMIEEKRKISALEGSKVNLPVRLSGQAPWLVKYRNVDAGASGAAEKMIWDQNGFIPVSQAGRYEITNVVDTSCPGIVDQSANTFEVSWIPRPNISMPSDLAVPGKPNTFEKEDICQGEDDTVEVKLSGRPPFNIKYEQYRKNDQGTSVRVQTLKSSSHVANLEMDTSQAGKYSYKILELSDGLYDHDPKSHKALVLSQTVHGLPSARFDAPGRVYAFCKEDGDGDELIPITLEGKPPFSLEVHIKHHSSAKEEVIPISSINTNKLKLPIPRKHLDLGQHVVSIRRVKDARKCQRIYDHDAPSVRVAVSDVPTIIPLESQTDYCVGDRLSFSLSGHAPFEVFYTFENTQRRATSAGTTFRRIAEKPGQFTITAVSDSASGKCKAHKNITKIIHPMPSVRVSKGRESVVDIHEGGEAELQFEFGGTPPFEFTYASPFSLSKSYGFTNGS